MRPYRLELLLILTAFFASLTGAAGERAVVRQVQGVAVVGSAQAAQASVQPARRAIPSAAVPVALRASQAAWPRMRAAPLRSVRMIFERRLE